MVSSRPGAREPDGRTAQHAADLRLTARPGREHAAGAAAPGGRGDRVPRGRQARVPQRRRQREGPAGGGHDRRRRARRPAPAGRHDRRADVGQHRCRPGHRRRAARLPLHLRVHRQGGAGEDPAARGVRRRGGGLPGRRRPRGPHVVLLGRRAAGERDPRRLPAEPVRQPVEPVGPRADHRARALAPDRRAHHPLRRRRRHRRHDHRGRPLPQASEPRHPDRRRRPGGLGVLRRLRAPVPGRGHRRGLLADHLRPDAGRPGRRRQRRGLVPHRPPGHPGRGPAHRRLGRHGGGRRPRSGPRAHAPTTSWSS